MMPIGMDHRPRRAGGHETRVTACERGPVPHLVERHHQRRRLQRGGNEPEAKQLERKAVALQSADEVPAVPSTRDKMRVPPGVAKAARQREADDLLAGDHAGTTYDADSCAVHAARRRLSVRCAYNERMTSAVVRRS